jgi:hypothetical protein
VRKEEMVEWRPVTPSQDGHFLDPALSNCNWALSLSFRFNSAATKESEEEEALMEGEEISW